MCAQAKTMVSCQLEGEWGADIFAPFSYLQHCLDVHDMQVPFGSLP